jgi:mRNA interferase HigB
MKVRLIKKKSIENFILQHARSRSSFTIWLAILNRVDWNKPSDIKSTFNSADLLGNASERVVFNIGGNEYRMICSFHFSANMVHLYIKWIGTHAEYTNLCSENKQYSINQF